MHQKHRELIDYIASHFYSIDKSKLLPFSRSILYTIVSNNHIKLENEDSLIDFIHQIFSTQSEDDDSIEINKFYSCVDFSELSEETLKTVLNRIDTEKFPPELWYRICECYRSNIKSKKQSTLNRYVFLRKNIDFDGDSNNSFNGIIAYLTNESNGNVHDNGTIVLSSSSLYSNNYLEKYAVEFNDHEHFFCTKNDNNNQWICYDFKGRKIKPTFYTIEIKNCPNATHHHPKFWVIEGSDDKENWKTLDTRNDDKLLQFHNIVQTYKIQTQLQLNENFKFIRFRQTGKSSGDSDYLSFTSLEFFGYLYEY